MIELKSAAELDAMREAGKVVSAALAAVRAHAAVGVSLLELDDVAASVIAAAGAGSSFQHYHPRFAPSPFPAVICSSVNDVIVHGIPDGYLLADGDLVSIDCGAHVDGWHGDSAISFVVGAAAPEDLELVAVTERALDAAIERCQAGGRLGDVSHAVGVIGRGAGYGILHGFGGHGVGRAMHEAPSVANEGTPGQGLLLAPGMVIAIEPMFIAGGVDTHYAAADGWSLHTTDGSRAAHTEHTVAITEDGPRVLTA
ncbi:type I methionyl aminopeptidase [Lentzea tibetensis]|uniref:Methionine aminopeptidase n=1 Tax=Lentzea tibetensis TaxID=2591470 RepID=A0A563EQB0_9PSEU|nr:type I methionyl aminopeptidase [Lentzea tibetensis]TWP49604.1 type I methionyl aminopeptidase [Lentzea tibetensis]